MPTWVKVIIGLVVVTIVGGIILVVVLFNVGQSLLKSAVDPNGASKTVHAMVRFEDPLPPGWKYLFNVNAGGLKLVSVKGPGERLLVNLFEVPNPKHQTADEMLQDPSSLKNYKNRFVLKSRGERMIGGQTMKYIRGETEQDDRKGQLEMGAVVLPSGKVILLQIFQEGETFDPAQAQPFLDKIKGFIASGVSPVRITDRHVARVQAHCFA